MAERKAATKLELRPGYCGCACGAKVSGKSRFKPGHDTRLKGNLLRAHRGGALVVVYSANGSANGHQQRMVALDAARLLDTERYSWSAHLEKATSK